MSMDNSRRQFKCLPAHVLLLEIFTGSKIRKKNKQATLFVSSHICTDCCSVSSLRKNWLYIQKKGYSTLKSYLTQKF